MRGKYGDVVTISLPGGVKWVMLNSPKAIQEGFVKQACLISERHSSYSGTLYNCMFMYLTDFSQYHYGHYAAHTLAQVADLYLTCIEDVT